MARPRSDGRRPARGVPARRRRRSEPRHRATGRADGRGATRPAAGRRPPAPRATTTRCGRSGRWLPGAGPDAAEVGDALRVARRDRRFAGSNRFAARAGRGSPPSGPPSPTTCRSSTPTGRCPGMVTRPPTTSSSTPSWLLPGAPPTDDCGHAHPRDGRVELHGQRLAELHRRRQHAIRLGGSRKSVRLLISSGNATCSGRSLSPRAKAEQRHATCRSRVRRPPTGRRRAADTGAHALGQRRRPGAADVQRRQVHEAQQAARRDRCDPAPGR